MYKTLLEYVQQGEVHGVNHGRKVILPASHYGSVRLEKFDCHINVEICSSLKVIKYLLWYPFKGDT